MVDMVWISQPSLYKVSLRAFEDSDVKETIGIVFDQWFTCDGVMR